jgi:hypothetical protein
MIQKCSVRESDQCVREQFRPSFHEHVLVKEHIPERGKRGEGFMGKFVFW